MKKYLIGLIFISGTVLGQTSNELAQRLEKHIGFLADDKLEGRRTGTEGEKLAYTYIMNEFKKAGLEPMGDNQTYIQAFELNEGKQMVPELFLQADSKKLNLDKDFFPLAFSANSTASATGQEIHYLDMATVMEENKHNPHFDVYTFLSNDIEKAAEAGKKIYVIHNTGNLSDDLRFDPKNKTNTSTIPVVYVQAQAFQSFQSAKKIQWDIRLKEKTSTGHNVVGFINNHATHSIILGAHYDHLGYGEDHNSLYVGKERMIHNGADDNASGTSALIELGYWLKKSGLKNYNYILVAFSGEELGLYGSKYFTENAGIDLKNANYMINMDMVGRLDSVDKDITIGGFGTSPYWSEIIRTDDDFFKIKVDSSGSGPSDHTSFYRKDMPVLFFFTGTHSDYHKPSDDAEKINVKGTAAIVKYIQNILSKTNSQPKLAFTKTREVQMGTSSFKVSLGIMPDYTYSGAGVRVDGIIDDRPAQKAGIQTGDVLLKLGTHPFTDVMSYMRALNKFNKGETTTVEFKRGEEVIKSQVTF